MGFFDILRTYTILTIGDGLATQVPALLTSTAAGMVVTRLSDDRPLGETVSGTVCCHRPEALLVAASALFFNINIRFYFPAWHCSSFCYPRLCAGIRRLAGISSDKDTSAKEEEKAKEEEAASTPSPENVEALLEVDTMEIEIGFGLIPIVDSEQGGGLAQPDHGLSGVKLRSNWGLSFPPIRIRDNMQLSPRQ